METKRKNHKFDIFEDICIICGVQKRKKPMVSDGYNMTLMNKNIIEYSKDGINFSPEYINCNQEKNGE